MTLGTEILLIGSKNIGVLAILVEGYNSKIIKKVVFSGKLNYQIFFAIIPLH